MTQQESNTKGLALISSETSAGHSQDEIDCASDTPVFPLNFSEMSNISKLLIKSAIPTSVTYVAEFVIGLACLRFIGKFGTPDELAGASLGFTWANVFCLGVFNSIDQGFSVMAARLYGAGKLKELGILFQRNLCVMGIVAIPLLFSLFFSEVILLALGLEPGVAASAGLFLRCAIPSIIGASLFNSMRFFLIAQNVFNIQGLLVMILVPLHVFWCYIFIEVFRMSVVGAAIAKCVTDISSAVILYLYITRSEDCKESWIPWNKECLLHWFSHLKKTLLLGANLYVEWISYEISVFIIGALNNKFVLGAHGIAINLTIAIFTIPLGNSISMQTFMGNAIGQGSKYKAQKFMTAGLSLNFILTLLNVLVMLTFSQDIAFFFTNDEETMTILQTMIIIYSLTHFADTFANHIGGILRIVGKEKEVFSSYVFCYVGIAFNLQWIFGLALGYGYKAVWMCTSVGMYLMLGIMVYKLVNMNWSEEMQKLRESEALETSLEEGMSIYIEMKEMD